MKKNMTAALCLAMVLFFVGCGKGDIAKVQIDYGTSSVYSKEEMDSAIKVIEKQFSFTFKCFHHLRNLFLNWISV